MSQFGGKMSKFYGKFDIVSTDLRIILSNSVATDVFALFKKSIKKICNIFFEHGFDPPPPFWTLLKKTADLVKEGTPYTTVYFKITDLSMWRQAGSRLPARFPNKTPKIKTLGWPNAAGLLAVSTTILKGTVEFVAYFLLRLVSFESAGCL